MSAFAKDCLLPIRERCVAVARTLDGVLYVWGGNTLADGGLDCSGYAQFVYARAGVEPFASSFPSKDLTAAGLWDSLKPIPEGEHVLPGDLSFYGGPGNPVSHVMMVTSVGVGGDPVEVMGAAHGDSTCKDPIIAKAKGARVRVFPSHRYWASGWRGFRRMPGV